ncbi:MAG: serine/threonine-protein kinase, partial [Acidobacteriota bacterium]
NDKATEIARQLCAGLAAAHAGGILHRDLKPANIMIDGRGQAKITDFGLSGLAGEFQGEEVRAGTPSYMAPEQLSGKDVSIQSDIYALGLVLYEVYTGRPAYEGKTLDEIRRSRSSAPTSPSSHVHELDPAAERVILRCLERDPADRPGSAIAVAAALPGGDPLADALAAGETPDPQLVAEAGAVGGLTPRVAISCVVAVVALMTFLIASAERFTLTSRTGLPKAPAVLASKAGEILADIGYDEPPGDSLFAFEVNRPYFQHLQTSGGGQRRWDAVLTAQPPAILFGYRQDSVPIVFHGSGSIGDWIGRSWPTNPGAVVMRLDAEGRLFQLDVVPPEHEAAGDGAASEPDWDKLLVAAGFDPDALAEAEPEWLPRTSSDSRRAWEGVYPDAPDVDIRIEASSYAGRPVSFRIIEPWTQPREAPPPTTGWMAWAGAWIGSSLYVTVLVISGFVAWRNVRLGRGDNRTAIRFAVFLAALRFVWFIGAHHVSTSQEIGILQAHLAYSAQRFVLAYVFYLAFEPYARKLWPHMLTSWVRLFDRRFRDPLVGRDLLIGVVFGTTFAFVPRLADWASVFFNLQSVTLSTTNWTLEGLRGFRHSITAIAGVQTSSLLEMFIPLIIILILRVVVRRTWIAVVLLWLMFMVMVIPEIGNATLAVPAIACGFVIWCFFLVRFGLLTLAVGITLSNLLSELSLTLNLAAWWSGTTWMVLALFAGITAWGFWASLAGRPVFKDEILGAGT